MGKIIAEVAYAASVIVYYRNTGCIMLESSSDEELHIACRKMYVFWGCVHCLYDSFCLLYFLLERKELSTLLNCRERGIMCRIEFKA